MASISRATVFPDQSGVMRKLAKWYRWYLTCVRILAAKMTPPPLPSEYDSDEIMFWGKRFVQWLPLCTTNQIANSLKTTEDGKILLFSKITSMDDSFASETAIEVTNEMWDLFWRQSARLVEVDPFFQITESDRAFLTAHAAIISMTGGARPAKILWKIFQLDPFLWENALVYLGHANDKKEIFEMCLEPITDSSPIPELRSDWCVALISSCRHGGHPAQATWLENHCALTDKERALSSQ